MTRSFTRGAVPVLLIMTFVGGCVSSPVREVGTGLKALLEEPGAPPSISAAVAVDGEIVLAEAFGWADEEAQIVATTETRYRAYSISKAITAIAVLQLVESGAVSLEDPIRGYVPELPDEAQPITLRQLLGHTSGIRHYKPDAGEISSAVEYPTLAASLEVFARDPLEFEPGTAYGYTSFGFNLLTGVVESVSEVAFGNYLSERVFEPAGATHSALDVAASPDPARARGYWGPSTRFAGNYPIDKLPNLSGRYGSSGVVSTPSDLVRILIALEENVLLQPDAVELLRTPPFPAVDIEQGHGWHLDGDGCRRSVYRSGAGTGFTGLVIHYPELRVGGAVLVDQNQWKDRFDVLERILEPYVATAARRRCP